MTACGRRVPECRGIDTGGAEKQRGWINVCDDKVLDGGDNQSEPMKSEKGQDTKHT